MADFASSTPIDLLTMEELVAVQSSQTPYMIFFWAAWHEPSKRNGQMQGIYQAMAEKYSAIKFYLVEAEKVPSISEMMEVVVVPTFLAMRGNTVVGKLEGANPSELKLLVKSLSEMPAVTANTTAPASPEPAELDLETLNKKLEKLINMAPVVLFMKGVPDAPKCGFSRQAVELLKGHDLPFAFFNILTDNQVRAQLKVYSDWPTYPQLYSKGELVGGLDILKEMAEAGNLKEQLGFDETSLPTAAPSLEDRCKALMNKAPVMVFMKGSPDVPKCGFSRAMISILNEQGLTYEYFDILTDEQVRTGLKILSDWPTYPQLYVKGELVGGLDIIQEMIDAGDFKSQIGLE